MSCMLEMKMNKQKMQGNKIMNKQSGFTLIEVMVVIVILGVLAALIVPNVMGRGEKAKSIPHKSP